MGRPDNLFAIAFEIDEKLLPSINRDLMVNKVLNALEAALDVGVDFWEGYGIQVKIKGIGATVKIARVFIVKDNNMNKTVIPIEKDEIVRYYKLEP